MAKIVKNTTGSAINVTDTGVTVPASPGQYTINASEYDLWVQSDDVIVHIGTGDLVVNDGSVDLGISDGTDLIKGIFQKARVIGDTDGTLIGNVGDRLKVDATLSHGNAQELDLFLEVPRGHVDNIEEVNKYGHNPAVGNSNYEEVWNGGGTYPWSAAAERVNIRSTESNDNATGTGARTVRLFGLDASYSEITEDITLNGTTNVLTTQSFLRMQRAVILTVGSGGVNEGDIEGYQQTSGDKLIDMPATNNQTQIATWTVPAGKTFYLVDWFIGLKTGKSTDCNLFVTNGTDGVFRNQRRLVMDESNTQTWRPYLKVNEKSDIRVTVKASTGSHEVSSGFNGFLVDGVE